MHIKTLIAATLLPVGVALTLPVMAADMYVIANNALALSEEDVRDVFVGDKQIAGGTKIVPMDNASLQKDFVEKVLKIDGPKYSNIWTKKGFRDGLNPPPVKSGDAEVIAAVKSTPGAVGYVSSAPAGVKLIKKY
jgi:ABC-type phosphate transport system substrate-binding protein